MNWDPLSLIKWTPLSLCLIKGLEKETGHGLRMIVSKYPIVID